MMCHFSPFGAGWLLIGKAPVHLKVLNPGWTGPQLLAQTAAVPLIAEVLKGSSSYSVFTV